MFQLCFNLNRIHDSVGKALRTAHPRFIRGFMRALEFFPFSKSKNVRIKVTEYFKPQMGNFVGEI
jgi:hypothetical protein